MKCPICGGELTPLDEKFVVCSTCGAKIPADRVAPAAEAPVPAPVEKGEEKAEEKTEEQKRLEELERRLAEMEEKGKDKKSDVPIGTRIKNFFISLPAYCRSHKKVVAFAALGLLLVIAIIITCVSLCGLRGVYVNENDPYEYYTFGVSSYTCTTTLYGDEYVEEGKYSISGNSITITVEDELFGTISDSAEFKKLDGYSKVMIGEDTYFRAGRSLNSKVKITFDPNGGKGGDRIRVQIGKTIKDFPTATKVGYFLFGWEDSNGKLIRKDDPIWQEKTYVAKWVKCEHTTMSCTDEKCPRCGKEKSSMSKEDLILMQHVNLDEHCVCKDCQTVMHVFDANGACASCGASDVRLSGTTVVGKGNYLGTNLVIPYGVTSIWGHAFADCTGLTSVTIPDSVTSIENAAFYGCSGLTSVTIGRGVTSIGSSAFSGCSGLTSVTIGSGVTSIGNSAFYGCTGLTSVTLPSSVTSIGEYAFRYCSSLTSVAIPDSVTSIGYAAFDNCSGLTSVTIGRGVTSIGDEAFCYCSSLTSVAIPDSVTSIGYAAFIGCTGLTDIYYTGDVAGWCGISGLKNIMSLDRTLYIGGTKVEGELVIPNGVTSIGDYAFYECSGLTSVTIGSGVTSIGEAAFRLCYKLVEVYNKSSLSITKGRSDNGYVGYYAKNVYETAGGSKLSTTEDGYIIYTDGDLVSLIAYTGTETVLTLPSGITEINQFTFYGCSGLTSVKIPDSVTSIGRYAFDNCSGLTSVTIGSGVTSIGEYAFRNCYKLVEVYNKSSLSITKGRSDNGYVGYYAKAIYTSDYVSKLSTTEDGYLLFTDGDLVSLIAYTGTQTVLTLPSGITGINQYAFYGCSGLTSVKIPDSVTSIGRYAFYECTGLTSVTIPSSVTSIGEDAFYRCTGLTSITIPDSVTSIGEKAFYGCTNLTSVRIGGGATSIGDWAFYGCTGLTVITYQGTKAQWNAIEKGSDWNNDTVNYTIHCADGDIAK